jgi:nitrogen regulatory protein PII
MKPERPYKLIVTIVKKGMASKLVKATKRAGAEGGTILLGKGTGVHEHARLFGIPIEPEKEIILTLAPAAIINRVLEAVVAAGQLNKPGTGIAFMIDARSVAGICHRWPSPSTADTARSANEEIKEDGMEQNQVQFDLIITIVNKGKSDIVVDATKRAGAEGGTIVYGRGTGIHEHARLFSIQIEPEKEIVLTLISRDKTESVLRAIEEDAEINKPGEGIAMVLPVERTAGINHPLLKQNKEQLN